MAAAHRLHELAPDAELLLLEAAPRLGGVLETVRQDGYLIERGADNFITNSPWGIELCRRLGLGDQLLETNHQHRHASSCAAAGCAGFPEGFVIMAPSRIWPVVTTPILSPWGKLRMAWEYFVPKRREEGDESLASFVTRRFGRETYDRLVQPLIGGIYTGDPEKLSVRATMPRFQDMERDHGSLIRAVWKQAGKPRSQMQGGSGADTACSSPCGMGSPACSTRSPRDARRRRPHQHAGHPPGPRSRGGWLLSVGGAKPETLRCDAVILAPKATAAARLMADIHPQLAEPWRTSRTPAAPWSRLAIAAIRSRMRWTVLASSCRRSRTAKSCRAVLRASSIRVGARRRALVRAFIGGEMQPELAALPDDELVAVARDELGQLLGISGEPNLV